MDSQCVVVGAGPAGLAVSRGLADEGVEHLVLERDDVAHTWRTQRWDSFTLNTPDWMNEGLRPESDPSSTCRRDEVVELLSRQAKGLPVRTGTPVTRVVGSASGFLVATPDGSVTTRTLVLASGMLNVPRTPAQAQRVAPRVLQLHAAEYRSAERLPDGAVLVVGGGQSGCQIAEDLALAGRTVYLSASRVGRIPWAYRGRDSLGWLVDCGFWAQRPEDLPNRADMKLAIPLLAGGRSLDLPILAGLGVRLLGHFASADGEAVGFDGSPAECAAYADSIAARITGLMERYITEQGIAAPNPEPEPRVAGPVPNDTPGTLDLRVADVTSVIWSTGFTGDLSWVRLPVLGPDGGPEQHGCASPVRGLWFVGFPWLTRRRSGIFHGFTRDARTVVDGVLREIDTT